jgi:hypothetical protein
VSRPERQNRTQPIAGTNTFRASAVGLMIAEAKPAEPINAI